MRVLVAFDKFKDALSAAEACTIAAAALRGAHPDWVVESCPLADGGDGFAEILTQTAGGSWQAHTVCGPRPSQPVAAGFGLVATERIPAPARALLGGGGRRLAVIEMASASGLARLPPAERNPWQTTSRGTGELLAIAAQAGADALLLGIGGSATHDLGLGALIALGWRATDASGATVDPVSPDQWQRIVQLEPGTHRLPPLFIACDVENPLLGPRGAAAAYAPQKGASSEDVANLEAATVRMASLFEQAMGTTSARRTDPGAGAAGGIAYGLTLAFGARLIAGAELVHAWLDLERRIAAADLVVTGEGRFDQSSLEGKGPGALVRRALALGTPVHVFAGQISAESIPAGINAVAISPPTEPLSIALRRAPTYLASAVERFARSS